MKRSAFPLVQGRLARCRCITGRNIRIPGRPPFLLHPGAWRLAWEPRSHATPTARYCERLRLQPSGGVPFLLGAAGLFGPSGCRSDMREIEQWLIRIGLDQYGPLFVEQAIDLSALPDLRNDDLKELGIPLGHRKRLLRAISELAVGATVLPDPSGATAASQGANDSSAAERRQITVLVCDLVDSTQLSTQLDPEDLSALLGTGVAARRRLADGTAMSPSTWATGCSPILAGRGLTKMMRSAPYARDSRLLEP